jgi:hypothetical protein
MKRTSTLIATFFLGFIMLNAQTLYYVDGTSGSDSNEGSINSPFATVNKACVAAVAEGSDTEYIIYASGTITEGSTSTLQFNRTGVTVSIIGEGANSTILQRASDDNFTLGETSAGRFFQLNNAKNAGLTLNINGVTFKNYGFTDTNGGCIINTSQDVDVTIKNCNAESASARSGAIVQIVGASSSITLESCHFTNMQTLCNENLFAPIYMKAGSLSVKNCVFSDMTKNTTNISTKDNQDAYFDNTRGSVIAIENVTSDCEVVIVNNTFYNNTINSENDLTTTQSAVSLGISEGTYAINATIANNLFIDNVREASNDADVNIVDDTYLTLVSSTNNVMNVQNGLSTADNDINDTYAYSSSQIDFTMDGDYPEEMTSTTGVKYVIANGTSIKQQGSTGDFVPTTDITGATRLSPTAVGAYEAGTSTAISELSTTSSLDIYTTNRSIIVEGEATNIKVYNIIGELVAQNNTESTKSTLSVNSKGIYIILVKEKNGTITNTKVMVE